MIQKIAEALPPPDGFRRRHRPGRGASAVGTGQEGVGSRRNTTGSMERITEIAYEKMVECHLHAVVDDDVAGGACSRGVVRLACATG